MKVNCGIVHVYMSYDNPHPSSALYSDKLTATDGHPAVLALEKTVDGRPLYMTFVGTQLPAEAADLKNCSDAHFETTFMSVNKSGKLKKPFVSNVCCKWQQNRAFRQRDRKTMVRCHHMIETDTKF